MDSKRIYLSPPYITEEELNRVAQTLRNGWVAPVGPELDLFEQRLAGRFNYPYVLCLNSGTAALHLAVKLAGIGQDDRVVIGSLTFVAAANAVLYEGGIPVFMDSERTTWNLDPDLLEEYLGRNPDRLPKAVIVTHIFGRPARMVRIREICQGYGIRLIEDAAEAVGTMYGSGYAGGFGDYGVLSFNGNKVMTTGGGGALICHTRAEYERALFWATQSRDPGDGYLHYEKGYNYRMSNVLAGLGLAQLEKLEDLLGRKRGLWEKYISELADTGFFEFADVVGEGKSNYWLTTALVRELEPDQLVKHLDKHSIEARRFWKPLHMQPLFTASEVIGGRVSVELFERGICLPSGTGMTGSDQERVINAIRELC